MNRKKKHQKATSKKRRDKTGSVLKLNTGKGRPESTVYTYVGNNEDPPAVTVYADTFPYQVSYGDDEVERVVYNRPDVRPPARSVIGYLIQPNPNG
jgi:hypothetical protein